MTQYQLTELKHLLQTFQDMVSKRNEEAESEYDIEDDDEVSEIQNTINLINEYIK